MTYRKTTPEMKDKMLSMRHEGATLREIGDAVGLHFATVGRLLQTGFASMGKYECTNCGAPTSSEYRLCKSPICQKLYHQQYYSGRQRGYYMKSVHGLTEEGFESLYMSQQQRCALCRQEKTREELRIDHDHETGQIRGLLCHHCNVGLGHFFDTPDLLRAAAEYLEAA